MTLVGDLLRGNVDWRHHHHRMQWTCNKLRACLGRSCEGAWQLCAFGAPSIGGSGPTEEAAREAPADLPQV